MNEQNYLNLSWRGGGGLCGAIITVFGKRELDGIKENVLVK